jgi:hypothetical protein
MVRVDAYKALAINSLDDLGAYLVNELPVQPIDGSPVGKFEREYARVPHARDEHEGYVYPYQFLTGGGTSPYDIAEIPVPTNSRIRFDYFCTLNAGGIPILKAPKYVKLGNYVYLVGQVPAVGDTEWLAEDSKLQRWKGCIWERATRYVPANSIRAY